MYYIILYAQNLYSKIYELEYDCEIVVGNNDSLIPVEDTLEIARKYNYNITYVNDGHCFENKG